jgi:hypothetical protein
VQSRDGVDDACLVDVDASGLSNVRMRSCVARMSSIDRQEHMTVVHCYMLIPVGCCCKLHSSQYMYSNTDQAALLGHCQSPTHSLLNLSLPTIVNSL